MIKDSREEDLQTKQEGGTNDHTKHPTSSRLWSTLRNPRIVRVSRAFGGKDRHSKVSTIRGLRDRRVRLSIPTAIQLYDLQDKLGLNQPSKVVDWLLNAAQHEIDKLPPLPLIPGNFIQFPQIGAKNDEENLNRAQAFSIADPMLLGNNSVADISLFPKATLNSYTSYHQIEPYVFSSYLTSPNPFQTPPSTFAQLLPWNYSSNINLKQYIHQDEAQQVEGMRGSSAIYKDSGGAHGSNAADFF